MTLRSSPARMLSGSLLTYLYSAEKGYSLLKWPTIRQITLGNYAGFDEEGGGIDSHRR
jgi:hypothetical protein